MNDITVFLDVNGFVCLDDPQGYAEQFFMSPAQWQRLIDEIKDGQHDVRRLEEKRGR